MFFVFKCVQSIFLDRLCNFNVICDILGRFARFSLADFKIFAMIFMILQTSARMFRHTEIHPDAPNRTALMWKTRQRTPRAGYRATLQL